MFTNKLMSLIFASLCAPVWSRLGPSYEGRSLNYEIKQRRDYENRESTIEYRIENEPTYHKDLTFLLKKGRIEALMGEFIRSNETTYYKLHGNSMKYTNASNLTSTHELNNTDKILYSDFADKNVFFLVTQSAPGEKIIIQSYSFSKYTKAVDKRGDCVLAAVKGIKVEIYSVKRFGDTKIFYIFAKETGMGINNWLHIEYHGFSNKIVHTYRVAITENDQNYNIAEAMPSNNFDNYNYTYIVQGIQDPLLEKNIDKIYLRVTIIKKSSPEKYSKSEVFELNFQEQINQKGYQVVGLGYFYPSKYSRNTAYMKQYAAILIRVNEGSQTESSIKTIQVNVSYSEENQRILVGLVNSPASTPANITSCHHRWVSQANRGEIVVLCRDPNTQEVQIVSMGFQGCLKKCNPNSYSPFPKLTVKEDEIISKVRFINVAPEDDFQSDTPISPMMIVRLSTPSEPSRVITTPYKGGKQQPLKNTLWQFEGFTHFVVSQNHYQYFVFKDQAKKRVAAGGNLGNMEVAIDLEAYEETDYIEAWGLGSDGKFTSLKTQFIIQLKNDTESFWNTGLNNGGPPINQLYKFKKRLFKIDNQDTSKTRYFVISGNLEGPQRVLPNTSPNRLNIAFYTESSIRNITIGVQIVKFNLNNTVTSVGNIFLKPRNASIKPSRRKTLEMFSNCSLTMESNFETIWCYNNFFQGYPKTKDPKDAYLGAAGYSHSILRGNSAQILELVGDTVVNIVLLTSWKGKQSRTIFGIQVPEWDKRYPNSSYISEYQPVLTYGIRQRPYYLSCNLTHPETSRPCSYYETRVASTFNADTLKVDQIFYLSLIEKFDLNQIPEFEGQQVLKIGSAAKYANIFYVTRKEGGQRSEIKILTRNNYTLKINSASQQLARIYRQIEHFELPLELGNDDNFDICFGSAQLVTFVSPSKDSKAWFPPRVYIYSMWNTELSSDISSTAEKKFYWKEIFMDDFGFRTIRRLQCFQNYFVVIGADSKQKTKSMTRLSIFGFYFVKERYSKYQNSYFSNPLFADQIDPLNLRRYNQILDNAPPGLEYQAKFIRLTQRNQIVFENSTVLVFTSAYKPWYKDDTLFDGYPPNTKAEATLSRNYTNEIKFEARALFHESIYYLKGFIFEDAPVDIKQTVVSAFGPPELNLRNNVTFSYVTLIDKNQIFKPKMDEAIDRIMISSEQDYNLSRLIVMEGRITSIEIYYSGGEVYNVTRNQKWPILTEKLYQTRELAPNRNRIIRRFSAVIDFSAIFPNRTKNIKEEVVKDKKITISPSNDPVYKEFISNIYLKQNRKPVDTIRTSQEWENVDIFTGSINSNKTTVAVFQSQYYNSTYSRYQTMVLAKLYTKMKRQTFLSMDAYESTFIVRTFRSLYLRQENNTLVPYMFISGGSNLPKYKIGGNKQFFHTFKGKEDFKGFQLESAGYLEDPKFTKIARVSAIKGPKRFYYIGRATSYSKDPFPRIMKAEYDFETKQWLLAKFFSETPLVIKQVDKPIEFMKCTQTNEFEDQALCLLYSGDGTSYVILYDPGDSMTPQGVVKSIKEIYVPPTNQRELEDTYSTFDITSNLIVKSMKNRHSEFEVRYTDQGVEIQQPGEYLYSGFMVWDLSNESQLPVIEKYFTTHFSDFTVAGNSIWTCSPKDGDSTVYNLALNIDPKNQILKIPDVEYLRSHFQNLYLRAKFVNGTVKLVHFNLIFVLPPDKTYLDAYLGFSIVIVLITGIYMCLRPPREDREEVETDIKLLGWSKAENADKYINFLDENDRRTIEKGVREMLGTIRIKRKSTKLSEFSGISQEVIL